MSLARSALLELVALTDVVRRRPGLPAMSRCRQQAEAMPVLEGVLALPDADFLETLRRDLRQGCAGRGGAEALPARLLRRTPLVLWNGTPQAASFDGLLSAFLGQARARPRWLRDLVEAWLRDFGPDRVALPATGHAIARALSGTVDRRLMPWRHAHEAFALFDAGQAARRVGVALLSGPDDVSAVMERIGMTDPLRANGRFFRAAIVEALNELPSVLRTAGARAAWPRIARLLEMPAAQQDRRGREMATTTLRFADLAGEVARACMAPWLRGDAHATAPKEEIQGFLMRMIGDPRVQPARWASAGEEATRLMCAWLAKASLEAFLSLISQNNADSQWRYRQQFWRACLTRMPSAEVWVVLGPALVARAKTLPALAGAFGRMEGANTSEQAVLLIRMGDLVLSEWSNIGPVRAWDGRDRTCPQLYQGQYEGVQLRARSLDFPDHPVRGRGGSMDGKGLRHYNGEDGFWQACAARLLFNRLNLQLTPKDYLH